MLEDLAIQLVSQSEGTLTGLGLGMAIVGAIIAAMVTRSNVEIARAPFFAYAALIIFAGSAVQIVWLAAVPAAIGGYLWVLAAISLAAAIASGYFVCLLAMARSRDAYGHARMAFLAFIPIANLWLLVVRSKNEMSANRAPTIPLLSGGLGVLTGFCFLAAAAGVNAYFNQQARMLEQKVQSEPPSDQAVIDDMIRSNGLEQTLRTMAAESAAQMPIAIDEVTTLAKIEAAGTRLRRTYIVDIDGWTVTEEHRARSNNAICTWPPFQPILQAGGAIREVYVERNGREIGALTVTRNDCRR